MGLRDKFTYIFKVIATMTDIGKAQAHKNKSRAMYMIKS